MVCLYNILVSSFHIHEVITDFDLKCFKYLKNFKYFDHNQGRFPQNTQKKYKQYCWDCIKPIERNILLYYIVLLILICPQFLVIHKYFLKLGRKAQQGHSNLVTISAKISPLRLCETRPLSSSVWPNMES